MEFLPTIVSDGLAKSRQLSIVRIAWMAAIDSSSQVATDGVRGGLRGRVRLISRIMIERIKRRDQNGDRVLNLRRQCRHATLPIGKL